MKLLVTGGAGFIGSAVVRQAVAQGHTIINVDALTYAACLENVESVSNAPEYTFELPSAKYKASARLFSVS